jgi:hypothetical protein
MRSFKQLVRLASCLLLLLPGVAGATSFVRVADADLADQAPVIAEVVFRGHDNSVTPNMPVTDYQVEIGRVLRGDLPGTGVVVRVQGGRAPSGMELRIHGAPSFAEGEKALLFLKPSADGTYRILHLMQGAFKLVENGGSTYAMRDFGEADEVTLEGREIEAERPRQLEKFKSWIADRVAGQERPADYFVEEAALVSSIQQKYTLLDRNGFNMRWPDFDASSSVFFFAHEAGQPGRTGGGFGDFETAINAWNDDGATNIRYRYGGTTSLTGGLADYDEVNVLLWDNLNGAGELEDPFSCSTGGTIAVGGPWFLTSTRHSKFGREFITIQGADIVTNDGLECWINVNRRLEQVLAHELGHTLGLSHSCGDDESGPCDTNVKNDALMRAQAHNDSRGASLRSDDVAAINKLYGNGVDAGPPSPPSNLQATSQPGNGVQLQWQDNSTDETSFRVERRTGGGSFGDIHGTGVNATAYFDTTAAPGVTYTYRVRAINGAGSSAYSNLATVTMAGEQTPSNLAATATGSFAVTLTWNDNAASETGYSVEARLGTGDFDLIASLPANSQGYNATGLFPDSPYFFRVRSTGGQGNSNYSNVAETRTQLAPITPCVPSATRLCLDDNRFQVDVRWENFTGVKGSGQVVPFGSADSGIFYFFSPNNWELLIKVLNGCGINNRLWVYAAATTDVEYTLVVTDNWTGRTKTYLNRLGVSSPAITDGGAFDTCNAPEPGGFLSLLAAAPKAAVIGPALDFGVSSGQILPKATCADTATALCVQQERFKVEVTWRDFVGNSDSGKVVPVVNADSGIFYFFSPNNWELLVKVLDGCTINNRVWVLAAATTDVAYTLKVTDMNNPGAPKTYTNPLGVASPAVIDIGAFAACN